MRAGRGVAFERDRVEVGDALVAPIERRVTMRRLGGAAEVLERDEAARPPTGFREQPGHDRRRRTIFREGDVSDRFCILLSGAVNLIFNQPSNWIQWFFII